MITMSGALPIVCGCSIYLVMIYISFASASNDVNSSSMNMSDENDGTGKYCNGF